MKFMITWKTRPGLYEKALKQFLETGAKPPKGFKTLGRWHVAGSVRGWHLLEGDDLTGVAEHVAEWANTLELEVHPVLEDTAAGEAAKRAFGK